MSTSTSSSLAPTSSLFPQTFTQLPEPTSTNAPDGGNASSNSSPQLATSASLYLYTFLATLVLLLTVSAAIILRSLLLRRRHRRMVEEAIRNGTWVHPHGGLGGFAMGRSFRGGVDPDKKPQMWEAYVEKKEGMKGYAEMEWDWDSIRPFSATIASSPTTPQPVVPSAVADSSPLPTSTSIAYTTSNPSRERVPLIRRIHHFISPPPPVFASLPPERSTSSNINVNSSPNVNGVVLPSGPQKVRVSVLIAMPSRPPPQSQSHPHNVPILKSPSPPALSPSPSPAINSATPLTHTSIPLALESSPLGTDSPQSPQDAADEDIPVIEFGVAEFMMREDEHKEEHPDTRAHVEGKRHLSMTSSMDV